MKLGFGLPVAGAWATPDALERLARRAEALGYHSLWVFQRLLYPLRPRNEYYGAPGRAWPEAFRSVLDPLVALAFVTAVTRTIRLGASVLVIPFYSPVVLGKQLATLDVLSRGRLDVGLGLGWSLDEYEAAGASWARRGARADEFLQCLKTVWTEEEPEFHGEFYSVPRARIEPRPVQKPHPPLLIGGYSDGVFRRAATLADGYTGGNIPLHEIAAVVARLRGAAERAGRDPATLAVVCRGAFTLTPHPGGPGRRALTGSIEELREDIRRYAECGVTELFLDPNFQPGPPSPERVLEQMEALAPSRREEA
ncbi:MAG: LLM class F420-dependent oxidoreductase [Candidatus Rokubacteria bacterium]|nr:LLM class F420-dependent oxidoreductase [Candidatus Rokubacteria bacterium]